jgi:enoyl-[acyl-carrier protein] reductase I
MGTLDGRTALVFGVANRHSLAWGIARSLHRDGARVGIVHRRPERAEKTRAIAREIGAPFVGQCDVTDDASIARVVAEARAALGPRLDVLVHSIARAEVADLAGRFVDTSRDGFRSALEVSAYSLVALARAAEDWLEEGSSIVTLTAIGSTRVIPHYNVMGVAKAALEASVRYLAADLGPKGIRVNAISAGAVRTAAAVTVPGFRETYRESERVAPLRAAVTRDDVGAVAAWLASDAARMVTGQVIQVDAGWGIVALTGGAAPG